MEFIFDVLPSKLHLDTGHDACPLQVRPEVPRISKNAGATSKSETPQGKHGKSYIMETDGYYPLKVQPRSPTELCPPPPTPRARTSCLCRYTTTQKITYNGNPTDINGSYLRRRYVSHNTVTAHGVTRISEKNY
jgi:hypothetical protein